MRQFVWTFPGGKKTIQKEQTTGTAGNVDTTLTVPAGKIWLLLNAHIELVADANAANRYIQLITQDVDNIHKFNNQASVITAGLTESRFFIWAMTATNAVRNALGYNLLTAGEDVLIAINSGLVGDSYKYLVEYLEIDA